MVNESIIEYAVRHRMFYFEQKKNKGSEILCNFRALNKKGNPVNRYQFVLNYNKDIKKCTEDELLRLLISHLEAKEIEEKKTFESLSNLDIQTTEQLLEHDIVYDDMWRLFAQNIEQIIKHEYYRDILIEYVLEVNKKRLEQCDKQHPISDICHDVCFKYSDSELKEIAEKIKKQEIIDYKERGFLCSLVSLRRYRIGKYCKDNEKLFSW